MSDANLRSKHAFGSEANVDTALQNGLIDAYDILFLSEGKIGWIDKDGNKVILEDKEQVIKVEELPETGVEDVVYIYNNAGYIWNSVNSEYVPLAKSNDLTALETQVSNLETQMGDKVDAAAVQAMVDTKVEEALGDAMSADVVEF